MIWELLLLKGKVWLCTYLRRVTLLSHFVSPHLQILGNNLYYFFILFLFTFTVFFVTDLKIYSFSSEDGEGWQNTIFSGEIAL